MDSWKNTVIGVLAGLLLVLVWLSGTWLGLTGTSLWLYRIGLSLLIALLAVGFLWLRNRKARQKSSQGAPGATAPQLDQLDALIHESAARLAASGRTSKLSEMSVVLVLGDAGSGKTTALVRSELEVELLAGQASSDNRVFPTDPANFWFAHDALLVDLGGASLPSEPLRARLFRRLRPSSLAALLGRGSRAPRAAVVCVSCESLLAKGAGESTSALARSLYEALSQACRTWGVNLPVYVLFTKMDRLPFFNEYVANLSQEEAAFVLGNTLPFRSAADAGTFAEVESRRLTEAYRSLNGWLADMRPAFLGREHEGNNLSAIYQFPREFSKLRTLVVQFLVELSRPSQLHASPVLRGFYFTGVRPVVVRDAAVSPTQSAAETESLLTHATGIFQSNPQFRQGVTPDVRGARKIPQWVFLSHLFPDVILKDSAAQTSSTTSTKANFWRRALFATAAALALIWTAGATVSYFNNSGLQKDALAAAHNFPAPPASETDLASQAALERLDSLRAVAERLNQYQQYGAPMSMRWGMYSGETLREPVSRLYFGHFRSMLLAQAQTSLLTLLRRPEGAQALGYKPVYDALKAYLITTSNPDKSTVAFLPPVLMQHWTRGRTVDPARTDLARAQFVFYSRQLPIANPYPSSSRPDDGAVKIARDYLARFAGTETLYQAMLADAAQRFSTIRFNQQFPGSAEVVRNDYPVSGAFTKEGWAFMENAARNPGAYFSGEQWVMGPGAFANLELSQLSQQLQQRYESDFQKAWIEFLRATTIVRYSGIPDAATKLQKTSSIQSPLLSLLCVVSENTSVGNAAITEVFQPAQFVTAPGCRNKLSGASNAGYVDSLIGLQAALGQLTSNSGNEQLRLDAINSATSALVAARQTSQNFRIDLEGQTHTVVQKLLEDPIAFAQNSLVGAQLDPINGAGRGFCADLRPLMTKYPFAASSTTQASLADLAAVFHPRDGALWRLYNAELAEKLLRNQGGSYVPVPGSIMVTDPFLDFFRRMAAVSRAFYGGEAAAQPSLSFTLQSVPTEGIDGVTLRINGQEKRATRTSNDAWQFAWPGSGPQEAKLQVKLAGGSDLAYFNYTGLWSVFQFLGSADQWQQAGSDYNLEWTLRTSVGDVISPRSGKPVTVRFALGTQGAPPVLRPGYLATLNCVPTIARNK